MNQVANRFANQPMIERRVSYSYFTLTSKETSHDGELKELLGVQNVINEIIFDQESRTTFVFYSRDIRRDIPQVTFTRV
jgi:hypothetical protein